MLYSTSTFHAPDHKPSNPRFPVVATITKAPRPKSKSLQPCRCPHEGCGKIFSKRSNLKAHMRIHDGVLPYPCNVPGCNKRFRWKSSLKPHIKVHQASGHVLPTDILNPTPIPATTTTTTTTTTITPTTPPIHFPLAPTSLPAPLPTIATAIEPSRPPIDSPVSVPAVFRPFGGPLPSPSQVLSLPFEKLPSNDARVDAGSPIAVTDPRPFDYAYQFAHNSPGLALKDTRQGRYACPHAGCNMRFTWLSDMTEHERNTFHADRRPPVMRRLFGDSHVSEVRMATADVDLHCNSALSSPIGSADTSDNTEVASLTLESSACTTEELWKTEIPLIDDPLDDAYLVFGSAYNKESLGSWMIPSHTAEQPANSPAEWMLPSSGSVGVPLEETKAIP